MLRRANFVAWMFGGSLLLLVVLGTWLWMTPDDLPQGSGQGTVGPSSTVRARPLVVYSAESFRVPLELVVEQYLRDHGRKVELRFGPSQAILTSMSLAPDRDLFFPADESFIKLAQEQHLLAEVLPFARMQAVVITRKGLSPPVESWSDLVRDGIRLMLANPDSAAIGKMLRAELQKTGRWADMERRQPVHAGNVNEVINAVKLGSVDAGVVWDVLAAQQPQVTTVHLPELAAVTARVQLAVVQGSSQPEQALHLAKYITAKDKGQAIFAEHGFREFASADVSTSRTEIVLYAGAMMQPAIEQTLAEFEQREQVKVTRVYNGCGILVGQMKTGHRPDVYFACDPQFMTQVQSWFEDPAVVSRNQLMIAVHKGNPHGIGELKDLGQPGLKVGVGHEQQCALGALTQETFLRTGVYAAVRKNIVVQSPTGDYLINQLRSGALDAVVAYRSNVLPYDKELTGIPITGIPCAAPQQPIAVSKSTTQPQLSQRLLQAIQSEASRQRFEKLGFGWGDAQLPQSPAQHSPKPAP